jgi:predicted amidohydrolase YtcJ
VHVITVIRDSNDVCGWGQIEHAQHLSAGAPERFQANGVVASVQPEHMLDDAYPAMRKLGEERAQQGSYLFNSLLGNGTYLALGSDWTVS